MSRAKAPGPTPSPSRRRTAASRSQQALAALPPQALATVLAAANDITVLLDAAGTVLAVVHGSSELAEVLGTDWVGRPFTGFVTDDSLPKVAQLLAAPVPGAARWRQVNHPLAGGATVPLHYAAQHLAEAAGQPACTVLLGRDQRDMAALQQRLVSAQFSMERDYARFRSAELRYRHLFQVAAEGVLVVDAASGKVVEANPAASAMLGIATERLVGQPFPQGFTTRGHKALQALMATVRRTGRAEPVGAELADGGRALVASVTLFHQEATHLLLVRLSSAAGQVGAERADAEAAMLLHLAREAPDGLVVTDQHGAVLSANAEFMSLCQATQPEQLHGQSLERWLGRPGVDLGVLLSNLRQRSAVKLFATTLRGEFGAVTEVEISAVMVAQSDPPVLGFTIRDVGRRLATEPQVAEGLPRALNQYTELVGRVPMKDIVGETTDLIEKRCIETALELTRDNRASAAEILGLSRQSLYVKLRRYGLGDLGADADTEK